MSVVEANPDWLAFNQRALMREVDCVRLALDRYAGHELAPSSDDTPMDSTAPTALDLVCARLGLSSFERKVLVLCAAPELDGRFAHVPTFGLALAAFQDAHWSAVTPDGSLRRLHLVEMSSDQQTLTSARLRIDEWLLHVLTGTSGVDRRLDPLLQPVKAYPELLRVDHSSIDHIVSTWSSPGADRSFVPIQLCGPSTSAKYEAIVGACQRLGWTACAIDASDIPVSPTECELLARLWEREAAVRLSALVIDAQDSMERSAATALARLVDRVSMPVAVMTQGAYRLGRRPTVLVDVPRFTRGERRHLWQAALGDVATSLNGQLEVIVDQFELEVPNIVAVAAEVQRGRPLWEACRRATRTTLDDLAQHIHTVATFDDLVVDRLQRDLLIDIIAHVKQRGRVFDDWQMAGPSLRGRGTSALFAGPSGTGKTLAAEVIANALSLDLYRIDLSQVISKYIGETEKNLRRVFDAAEEGGAVLLFDEADALFGKRSEVRDSHDRYANVEISYLLQRMEAYRGVAILTTNMRNAIDQAFMRRLRFVVPFPFPDLAQREQLWRKAFSPVTPIHRLDFARLARLSVSGGNIRNIAVYAALLAAERDEAVGMSHLLRAAVAECAKLERTPTDSEIAGWE